MPSSASLALVVLIFALCTLSSTASTLSRPLRALAPAGDTGLLSPPGRPHTPSRALIPPHGHSPDGRLRSCALSLSLSRDLHRHRSLGCARRGWLRRRCLQRQRRRRPHSGLGPSPPHPRPHRPRHLPRHGRRVVATPRTGNRRSLHPQPLPAVLQQKEPHVRRRCGGWGSGGWRWTRRAAAGRCGGGRQLCVGAEESARGPLAAVTAHGRAASHAPLIVHTRGRKTSGHVR